jgi:SAM-dependent methyltransferase
MLLNFLRRIRQAIRVAFRIIVHGLGAAAPSISPREHQPRLPLPEAATYDGLLASLVSFAIDATEMGAHEGKRGELETYAREDYERFLHTLALVPHGALELLEIGANPYFTTYLLKKFRPEARLTLANSFGGLQEQRSQTLSAVDLNGVLEHFSFEYTNTNIETQCLPFGEAKFDVVLFCEVIEHLIEDPVRALLELKRVLNPGGLMLVTTPNVARLENVARLVAGANLYDPYSGYGVYGRHNREYTRHELWRLMTFCGFSVQQLFTADVHANRASGYTDLTALAPLLEFRAADLGQYLFSTWRNDGPAPTQVPGWLYRSMPAERIDPAPL